ncbi:MAG: BspA family leucine-rich repeat surface protein, partial [Bacteroidaceae bacterium]|nr:BspA family leucine-rich repeat surface protein [Bacteroidaceae bacterium]
MKHIFTILLSIILLGTSPVCALAQEAYAVMSPDSTTLTFYYDNQKASRQGTAYELNEEDSIPKWVKLDEDSYPQNPNFTTVVFDESFKDARPISCTYWFAGFRNLTKIEGINNLNTSNVTNMSDMFSFCESLTSLDVRNFDTSKVTDMCSMFRHCESLTSIDVSRFDTSKVTDMDEMFHGCESLTTLDVSKFNTSKVTYMSGMFEDCASLTTLDLSN